MLTGGGASGFDDDEPAPSLARPHAHHGQHPDPSVGYTPGAADDSRLSAPSAARVRTPALTLDPAGTDPPLQLC